MKWRIGTAEGSLHRDPASVQEEGPFPRHST